MDESVSDLADIAITVDSLVDISVLNSKDLTKLFLSNIGSCGKILFSKKFLFFLKMLIFFP